MNIKEKAEGLINKLRNVLSTMPEEVAMSAAEEPKAEAPVETTEAPKTDEVPAWAQDIINNQREIQDWMSNVEVEEVAAPEPAQAPVQETRPEEPKEETVSKAEYDKLRKDFNKFKKQQEEAAQANEGFKHDPEAEVRNTNERVTMPDMSKRPFDARQNVYDTIAAYNKK